MTSWGVPCRAQLTRPFPKRSHQGKGARPVRARQGTPRDGGTRGRLVITIDGPTGTGKSTAARRLARRLGYLYLDTGAMYRAVALEAVNQGADLTDAEGIAALARRCRLGFRKGSAGRWRVFLGRTDVTRAIRRPEIGQAASRIAVLPALRRELVRRQRLLGKAGGIVAEGRDTGTVVFPSADLKIFLTADLAERVRRRHAELIEEGASVTRQQVLREVRQRDRRDRLRKAAPLKPASGAVRINNTKLKSDQVLANMLDYVGRINRYGHFI